MKLLCNNALVMLKADWAQAKDTGWTQQKIAKALGVTQPSFSQYLRGEIPLNVQFLLKYASVRGVAPEKLGVKKELTNIDVNRVELPVRYTTSGVIFTESYTVIVTAVPNVDSGQLFLVEVDSDFRSIPKGAFLIASKGKVKDGSLVVAQNDGRIVVGTLKNTGGKWAVIQPLTTGDIAIVIDKTWEVSRVLGLHYAEPETNLEFEGA